MNAQLQAVPSEQHDHDPRDRWLPVRVEKNVGIPTGTRAVAFSYIFPLVEMEVGESFQLPNGQAALNRANTERSRIQKDRPGRKYSIRKYMGGRRMWRVA